MNYEILDLDILKDALYNFFCCNFIFSRSCVTSLKHFIKNLPKTSLVAQWLRICLLMQETRVRALVWEDPTCHGAAGPVSHSC